jgi:hypothetical protein
MFECSVVINKKYRSLVGYSALIFSSLTSVEGARRLGGVLPQYSVLRCLQLGDNLIGTEVPGRVRVE